jgi:hypothetical protein
MKAVNRRRKLWAVEEDTINSSGESGEKEKRRAVSTMYEKKKRSGCQTLFDTSKELA